MKVKSPCLVDISAPYLFHEVLKTSFKHGHDYEVMDTQKTMGESHAFIKTTSPELVKKMIAKHIIVNNEVLLAREVFDTT